MGPRAGYALSVHPKQSLSNVSLRRFPTANPFSVFYRYSNLATAETVSAHSVCRSGEQCTGPGCHVRTGKTAQEGSKRSNGTCGKENPRHKSRTCTLGEGHSQRCNTWVSRRA